MARLRVPRRLDNQTLLYDEINWETDAEPPLVSDPAGTSVTGPPTGLRAAGGLTPESSRPPYWEFSYQLNDTSGIVLTDVNVRDTQSVGSSEPVFEKIEFTDLEVTFRDNSTSTFNLASAISNTRSRFVLAEQGTRFTLDPPDSLFQRGLKITFVDNILAAQGGRCDVTLEISVVFRGAANDFDPGGIPVAMDVWPQIAWTWSNEGATKRVRAFRGSIVMTTKNKMFGDAMPSENIASFFTDSNTSMTARRGDAYGFRALSGSFRGLPFGWGMIFDYTAKYLQSEKEIVGVYGPDDGNFYSQTTPRRRRYRWHNPVLIEGFHPIQVHKANRQGYYDNIHTHAKMPRLDECNKVQIHAPFCGHSCVHLHWRWSSISSDGATGGRGWQFKGWSGFSVSSPRRTAVIMPQAHHTPNAPLIPPNQKLKFAICHPATTRFSQENIVNSATPRTLDSLRKKYWYAINIVEPNANQKQVIFEHGIGWAYRYAKPNESSALRGLESLPTAVSDDLPNNPTQADMARFFENDVYPVFRYMSTSSINYQQCRPQVPEGTYDQVDEGGSDIAMEAL